MAKSFADRNYLVFATLRNPSKAGNLAESSNIQVLDLDVASTESIARCAERVTKLTGGTLDVLVNNAGVDFVMPLLDVNIDRAKEAFDVNFWGPLAVTQAFEPMVRCLQSISSPKTTFLFRGGGGGFARDENHSRSTQCSLSAIEEDF